MGLVALATVADVVPLRGENRILVAAGLAALRRSTHPGIRALLEVAQVGATPLTTEDVGFRIGPRLNAAGRLSKPGLVIDLLTESDPQRCRALAKELDEANLSRRRIERGVLEAAQAQAESLLGERERSALVVWDQGWHVGVVGIVAARLVDRYHRPAVVIGFDGEVGRGSCRTPPEINVHDALAAAQAHISSFGGHAMAAGLELADTQAESFRRAFEDAVDAQGTSVGRRSLVLDVEADVDDMDLETVHAVRRLAPFGNENPEPVFLLRGAEVAGVPKLMGNGSAHLSFALKQRRGAIRVVGWRRADLHDVVASKRPLDLAVTPYLNEWRGITTPELRLVDLRESAGDPPTA